MAVSSRSAIVTLLRQPRWWILTLLVPIGVVLCLLAASWQYDRHVARSEQVAQIEANSDTPTQLLTLPAGDVTAENRYQPVSVTGAFTGTEMFIRRKVFNGNPGYWVASQMREESGNTVWILRGWVGLAENARTNPTVPPPPTGTVTVNGWLDVPEQAPETPPTDLPTGQAIALDPRALGPADAVPAIVVAQSMTPPDPGLNAGITVLPVPSPGLGPHLAYSWQWIVFALFFPIGWFVLFKREVTALKTPEPETVST